MSALLNLEEGATGTSWVFASTSVVTSPPPPPRSPAVQGPIASKDDEEKDIETLSPAPEPSSVPMPVPATPTAATAKKKGKKGKKGKRGKKEGDLAKSEAGTSGAAENGMQFVQQPGSGECVGTLRWSEASDFPRLPAWPLAPRQPCVFSGWKDYLEDRLEP